MSDKKLITIDCEYLKPKFAAAYLRVDRSGEKPRALFVENNTAHAVPLLLRALAEEGLTPDQVEYLIITHVHFDHAGGTSELMKVCPNAQLLAHPKAAPHMIDPSRLVASAREVYGDAVFDQLYGTVGPVPADRVRVMADGEELAFGATKLRFIYTRGHANHHFCVFDSELEAIFTGDSFGLAYPALQPCGLFIFPSTSPTGYHAVEAKLSIDKILNSGARRAFLTHYGEVTDLPAAAAQLRADLDFSETLQKKGREIYLQKNVPETEHELTELFINELHDYYRGRIQKLGLKDSPEVWDLLKLDLDLNASGIAFTCKPKTA